jgi:hypothetical protein
MLTFLQYPSAFQAMMSAGQGSNTQALGSAEGSSAAIWAGPRERQVVLPRPFSQGLVGHPDGPLPWHVPPEPSRAYGRDEPQVVTSGDVLRHHLVDKACPVQHIGLGQPGKGRGVPECLGCSTERNKGNRLLPKRRADPREAFLASFEADGGIP